MGLTVKTAPANKALYLSDAKSHLRVRHDNDNRDILLAIDAATAWLENYTERSLITRTYELSFDAWPDVFEVERGPLIDVVSLTYYDSNDTLQTVDPADYYVDPRSHIGRVKPVTSWPDAFDKPNTIILEYTAGYGATPLLLPNDLQAALKLLVGHFYDNREQNVVGTVVSDLKFGVDQLIAPYIEINV